MLIRFLHKTCFSHYFSDDLPEGVEYQVVGDIQKLIDAEKEKSQATNDSKNGDSTNGGGNGVEGEMN